MIPREQRPVGDGGTPGSTTDPHAGERASSRSERASSRTDRASPVATAASAVARIDRLLAGGLVVLGVALAANAVLGPLVTDTVTYPFSETLVNQTIGLEAVTLGVVVPWCLAAAVLLRRGHRAGPVAAIPPAAYAVYMMAQYVVGPEYVTYRPVVALHLGIFVLAGVVLAAAWPRVDASRLPTLPAGRGRRLGVLLVLFGAFILLRYLGAVAGMASGAPLEAEYAADPSMYWSIVLLDVGVVVPATVATAVGLLRGSAWAERASYAVVGWFVLVPLSVAAMSLVMVLNGDPNASTAGTAVLGGVTVVFVAVAAWAYRPLVAGPTAT